MRCFLFFIPFLLCLTSCSKEDEETYTGRQTEYVLQQANPDYAYEGRVLFKEMKTGELEITIQLTGNSGEEAYFFPAHLHYGTYDTPEAPMAAMLNPVDMRILKSVTVLGKLARGEALGFDDIENFDGHVKVHLAEDGPEYQVILVAGNIGSNESLNAIEVGKVTLCAPF